MMDDKELVRELKRRRIAYMGRTFTVKDADVLRLAAACFELHQTIRIATRPVNVKSASSTEK